MNFVSLLTPDYLPGVFALLQSIADNSCLAPRPHFTLVCENMPSAREEEALRAVGLPLTLVDRRDLGDVPATVPQEIARFDYTFKKLLVFKVRSLSPLCFVDSDMLCINSLTGIEHLRHFSAAPDVGISEPRRVGSLPMVNSGFFVYTPSATLHDELVEYLRGPRRFTFGDQELLTAFFGERRPNELRLLNTEWNTLKRVKHHFPHRFDLNRIRFLHYVGPKPWNTRLADRAEWVYICLNRLWWRCFSRSPGPAVCSAVRPPPSRALECALVTTQRVWRGARWHLHALRRRRDHRSTNP